MGFSPPLLHLFLYFIIKKTKNFLVYQTHRKIHDKVGSVQEWAKEFEEKTIQVVAGAQI